MRIKFVEVFTDMPIGRYRSDGNSSAEVFRDDILAPALLVGDVELDLSGAYGYGSSFLEESFGGLLRHHDLTAADLRTRLTLVYPEDPATIELIWQFVDEQQERVD